MARDETIKLSLIDGVTKSLTAIQKGVGGVGAELAKLNQVAELAGKGFVLGRVAAFFLVLAALSPSDAECSIGSGIDAD